ncbi:MAG: DNA-packaging protein [Ruminococcus sp.]|nr:DNA-packaging protein [Ruminococcus sp.]MBR1752919.1 DNA-packaging protein [Ruminococcus sp.]
MTDNEKLEMLKTMVDEQASDSVLSVYLSLAKQIVLAKAYPFGDYPDTFPEKYDMTQIRVAEFLYMKRGAEGEISHSENGISRAYENGDVPDTLLRSIVPFAKPMITLTTNEEVEADETSETQPE